MSSNERWRGRSRCCFHHPMVGKHHDAVENGPREAGAGCVSGNKGWNGSASTRDSCGLPRALELSALRVHVTLPGYLDNDPEGFLSH